MENYDDEVLYHHGILGMRWGVRRYQNKDGTLTAAGQKRAAKLAAKYAKVTGDSSIEQYSGGQQMSRRQLRRSKKFDKMTSNIRRGKNVTKSSESLDKVMAKMSDEEIAAKIDRMRLESLYRQKVSEANPAKVSYGRKFMDNMKDNLVRDVPQIISNQAKNALGKYLENTLEKKFDIPVSELLTKDMKNLTTHELNKVGSYYETLAYANKKKADMSSVSDLLKKDTSKLTQDELNRVQNYYNTLADVKMSKNYAYSIDDTNYRKGYSNDWYSTFVNNPNDLSDSQLASLAKRAENINKINNKGMGNSSSADDDDDDDSNDKKKKG